MLARLGPEAADAIDEFLNLALAYDDSAPPSLQGFLAALREGQREVKRDMEQGRNEVRVMTVHGAKGLEAPIVFLPDTCTTRSARPANGLLVLEDAVRPSTVPPPFLWPVKGTSKVGAVQQAKARIADAETEERNRLLYVALTRARDRLYVAGFEGLRAPPDNCWYNLIKNGLDGHLQGSQRQPTAASCGGLPASRPPSPNAAKSRGAVSAGVRAVAGVGEDQGAARADAHHAARPLASGAAGNGSRGGRAGGTGKTPAPAEPPILPPVALAEDGRFLRGTLTHALLEHLPGVPQRELARGCRGLPGQPCCPAFGAGPQGHRYRDAGRAGGRRPGAAVRPRQPRRGGDCRRGCRIPAGPAPSCA